MSVGKQNPHIRQSIQIWSRRIGVAIQTTHVIVQVIDSYDDKIGLRVLRPYAQQ